MHPSSQFANAGIAAGTGLLSMLALSFVFPALANPVGLAIGAAAGLALALRDQLPHEERSLRLGLVFLAIASAAIAWASIQPGYIGV
jgi:hypothetical protein